MPFREARYNRLEILIKLKLYAFRLKSRTRVLGGGRCATSYGVHGVISWSGTNPVLTRVVTAPNEPPPPRYVIVINMIRRVSWATATKLYNCRLLDKKIRQIRGVDLGRGGVIFAIWV